MATVKLFNPDIERGYCCGYGFQQVLDMLYRVHFQFFQDQHNPNAVPTLTEICPSCGTTITLDCDSNELTYKWTGVVKGY